MPGLSFRVNFNNRLNIEYSRIEKIVDSLILDTSTLKKELFKDKNSVAYSTGYSEYPISQYNIGGKEIFLEGKIYNRNNIELKKDFEDLIIILKSNNANTLLKEWLLKFDGDFIILVYDPTNMQYKIINDQLGRLPFYLFRDNEKVVISREMKFVYKQISQIEIEKYGIAECLLFGYPLGKKTYIKNLIRVPPASFIQIDVSQKSFQISTILEFNFERKKHEGKGLNELTDDLAHLFLTSTKNRYSDISINILSLSGGLDSRSVLGALRTIGKEFKATTFVGYNKVADKDAHIAGLLSRDLNFPWSKISLGFPNGKDLRSLLYSKAGTNTLGQTFLANYHKEIIKQYGRNITFFTGDGGDKVFPDLRSTIPLSDVESLVKYTVSNKYFFNLKKISDLLNLKENELFDHLADHFSNYPESTPAYKFQRFMIMERGVKWLFETEDKNRCSFWTTAPMYAYKFFEYGMNIPDEFKSKHVLYYNFISKINSESLKYKNALWGVTINPSDPKYLFFLLVKDKIYPRLPSYIKKKLRMNLIKFDEYKINRLPQMQSILSDLANNSKVNQIFRKSSIHEINKIGRAEFYILLTLLSAIEYYFEDASSLSNYLSDEFI